MTVAFDKALKASGYVSGDGHDAAGLLRPKHRDALRLRSVFANERVGLNADALFFVQGAPTILFKDAGAFEPSDQEVRHWREAAWNIAVAPLLWIITPTEVRLYDCYRAPRDAKSDAPLGRFSLETNGLTDLKDIAGRLATETGAFWSSPLGSKIDRRHRVDRELLGEISALEAKLTALPATRAMADPFDPAEQQASRDFAQRLIGRCIFTWYLFDRGIVDAFRPKAWSGDLVDRFATSEAAFDLFDWLRSTFNGDLFPMDDPGAERSRLGDNHLGLIRDFIRGQSLVNGQGRLFRFRFDAIPVDLISSIYQQFARSSAAEDAHRQGLHYTPVELVHLTLDPVFEQLDPKARIIDPTCGSGAFLVEAFRRLVWRRCGGLPAKRAEVREILYTQLFGVDINRSALGIAAFSLYLAALEFDEEPLQSLADLKFDRLIGVNLFEADALNVLPPPVTARPFDAVVGNPPWTFDSDLKSTTRKAGGARPRRSPDQAFLKVAARLAGDAGRVGMVMKATPFFSREDHAVTAREELLKTLAPVGLINLSALRREGLFPDATAPALLLFARCAQMPNADEVLVGSVPWTPDFRRNGLFHLGPGEVRPVLLKRLLKTPALLKAAAFGAARDVWLIERLEREHPPLEEVLGRLGIAREARGQGYQVKGSPTPPPAEYARLKTLTPTGYLPFRLDNGDLTPFSHETLHRPRTLSIFKGPILLCPKGSFTAAAEAGRYSAAVYPGDLLYTENFYGISFANSDPRLAHVLSGVLNSSLTTFQLVFGGGAFGLERSTVEPKDLLSLRIPDLKAADPEILGAILIAEAKNAERPGNLDLLLQLDEAVADLYDLDRHELTVVQDSVARARALISESRAIRNVAVRPPSPHQLADYAFAAMSVVNGYLEAKGERSLSATIYSRSLVDADWAQGAPGLTAVRYHMEQGRSPAESSVWYVQRPGSELIEDLLDRGLSTDRQPPYLNERRQFRLYIEGDLIVVKPSEARYWTRTAGLNDADLILADHWFGKTHVRS